jgi:molybdate transport system substrate-binding protein
MRRAMCWSLIVSILFCGTAWSAEPTREPLLVFAAASLTDVLERAGKEYTQQGGVEVKFSFAATSALAKQLESGGRADVFVSADQEWMDYLDQRNIIDKGSRADLLGNKLVLIAPADSRAQIKLAPGAPLLKVLGDDGKLATGDPDSVPVGKYAKAALTSLNLWDAVQPRIARADNVRVALMYVARGEAPLGIVYATDVAAEPKVKVLDTFPATSHPPITYPIAATKVAQPAAKSFIAFLRGPAARVTFEKAGFSVLGIAEATATAQGAECSDFKFDVSRELELLKGSNNTQIAVSSAPAMIAKIEQGRAYQLALKPQDAVQFVAKPDKPTMNDGSFAGLVTITPSKDGMLRVGLSEAAWIDVVANGKSLPSTDHAGSHNCSVLRKAVQFDVKKGQPLVLQLSGSTAQSIRAVITQ